MDEKSLLSLKSIHSLALRDIENNPSTINFWLVMMFMLGRLDEINEIIDIMSKNDNR